MRKCFCDACGDEIESRPNKAEILVHVVDMVDHKYQSAYVDNDGNHVSGRHVDFDLCNKCYNLVMVPAARKLRELQRENAENE